MRRFVGALLAILIGALALADTRPATDSERVAETLKQLERDWLDAEKAGDSEKLGRMVADDWAGFDNDGRRLTKEQLIARIKSGDDKLESAELGQMDVKVLGEAAIVQGSDIEINARDSERTKVEIIWMDVFAYRGGRWMCVRSQSARAQSGTAGTASRPRWSI